jgi:hypothetical protein
MENELSLTAYSANDDLQRIPQFYLSEVAKVISMQWIAYEGYKCCIIYELLHCIHSQFRKKCIRISFGPMDQVIHLFMIEFRNNCFHYTIDNELFDMISGGKSHPSQDRNKYQRCEHFLTLRKVSLLFC